MTCTSCGSANAVICMDCAELHEQRLAVLQAQLDGIKRKTDEVVKSAMAHADDDHEALGKVVRAVKELHKRYQRNELFEQAEDLQKILWISMGEEVLNSGDDPALAR